MSVARSPKRSIFYRDGVWKFRTHFGTGDRVYYAKTGQAIVLLTGSAKRRLDAEIERAAGFGKDWQERT